MCSGFLSHDPEQQCALSMHWLDQSSWHFSTLGGSVVPWKYKKKKLLKYKKVKANILGFGFLYSLGLQMPNSQFTSLSQNFEQHWLLLVHLLYQSFSHLVTGSGGAAKKKLS